VLGIVDVGVKLVSLDIVEGRGGGKMMGRTMKRRRGGEEV